MQRFSSFVRLYRTSADRDSGTRLTKKQGYMPCFYFFICADLSGREFGGTKQRGTK